MNDRASQLNQKVALVVGTVDSLNLMSIFTLFLTDVMREMLQQTARFIVFPVSGTMAAINAILAIRQAKLAGGKNGTLLNAVIETLSALGVVTVTIGGFVAASIFATVTPIVFTVIMSAKTLFHFGALCYYLGCAAATNNDDAKAGYLAAARGHGVATAALSLATVAVALVMIAAKPIMGVLGIIAGAISIGYAIYKLVTSPPLPQQDIAQKAEQEKSLEHMDEDEPSLTNGAKMHKTLNVGKTQVNAEMEMEQLVTKPLWQNLPKTPSVEKDSPSLVYAAK